MRYGSLPGTVVNIKAGDKSNADSNIGGHWITISDNFISCDYCGLSFCIRSFSDNPILRMVSLSSFERYDCHEVGRMES